MDAQGKAPFVFISELAQNSLCFTSEKTPPFKKAIFENKPV